jgi:hypothetical protein
VIQAPDPFEQLVDTACNGMSHPQRSALEERMQADLVLRDAVELQRRIDGSLHRLFSPPACLPLPFDTGGEGAGGSRGAGGDNTSSSTIPTPTPSRVLSPWRRWAAAAAMLALLVLGTWNLWIRLGQNEASVSFDLDGVYERAIARELPVVAPDDPDMLAAEIERRFGAVVQLASLPPDVTLLSVLDCSTFSTRTLCLLASAGHDHVVLLIDTEGRDYRPRLPRGSGLRVHRAEAGALALFEISPRRRPVLSRLVSGGRRPAPCGATFGASSTPTTSPPPDLQERPGHTDP